MIVVRLEGGIGNQMFQYATAKSLASRLRSNLFYDDSLLKLFPLNINGAVSISRSSMLGFDS